MFAYVGDAVAMRATPTASPGRRRSRPHAPSARPPARPRRAQLPGVRGLDDATHLRVARRRVAFPDVTPPPPLRGRSPDLRVAWPSLGIIVASWILTIAGRFPSATATEASSPRWPNASLPGDTLYVDVWDNKEPLFYLTLAAGRLVSPYMDVVIELAGWPRAAIAVYLILRSSVCRAGMSALAGLGMTPLILTGGDYAAGFSHLPGTAIVLGMYALLVRRTPPRPARCSPSSRPSR